VQVCEERQVVWLSISLNSVLPLLLLLLLAIAS